ncbi:TPA: helix-turn-helix domain-containing protein [Clostridium botulinum]|uniref:helix-turn-helix domain-containing protein n=1 Tax=Clostridium botulinum TaxID=1491 RepID=UPI000B028EA1|nr:helix-turn-helix domain-containing protein [Clostridium botulinum]HCL4439577.1 helix-turn-helix domain-containing protein [Clostridium botulinum]HCL4451831.1 helix-turn-helix domain-containing protein [Clostridium botulinum]HCL4455684.1 helix-turn-helix domain-containing protein [Clostridium botulinum]HCL4466625.1 helix-turn-helix domain-containing protein [Clostridium botulinum]HCL4470267.1 helix-turn-helix domain-containing protein [Clostridium botulinum]
MENIRGPDIKEQAERDYISGMKYKDIAAKYNVSINTVKNWKQRYKWNRKSVYTKTE